MNPMPASANAPAQRPPGRRCRSQIDTTQRCRALRHPLDPFHDATRGVIQCRQATARLASKVPRRATAVRSIGRQLKRSETLGRLHSESNATRRKNTKRSTEKAQLLPSFTYRANEAATAHSCMPHRLKAIALIEALSKEEGTRQPTAAAWLQEQDRKRRNSVRPALEGTMRLSDIFRRFPLAAF